MGAYIEAAADRFDYDGDWKEVVADTGGGGASFSWDAQENTRQGYIKWNKQRAAARHFLGFAYADTAAPWRLHRENPQWDPDYPWLYAHSISFSPMVVKANTANPNNSPYVESPFAVGNYSSNYEWVLATVKYRAFRHKFLNDGDVPTAQEEYKRNCTFTSAGRVEVLSADGASQLKFAETSAAGGGILAGPNIAGAGTAFPAPIGILLPKLQLNVEWTGVPNDYLSSNANVFIPTKILTCLGKVNSTAFLGFPAGTLLMQPFEYTEFTWPVASDTANQSVYELLRGVNIRLSVDYFDPTPGAAVPVTRGHRLMPWRLNGRFYLATYDGAASVAKALIEEAEFNNIFTHVSAP